MPQYSQTVFWGYDALTVLLVTKPRKVLVPTTAYTYVLPRGVFRAADCLFFAPGRTILMHTGLWCEGRATGKTILGLPVCAIVMPSSHTCKVR